MKFRLIILGGLLALAAVTTPARAATGPAPLSADSQTMASQVNAAHKAACGSSVTKLAALDALAMWRAQDMATRGYFSHTILGGTTKPWDYLAKYSDNQWSLAGEDIAWNNYPSDLSENTAWTAFRNSPDHWALITGCDFNAIGVGAYQAADGKKYFAIEFTHQRTGTVRVSSTVVRSGDHPWSPALRRLYSGTRVLLINRYSTGYVFERDSKGYAFIAYGSYR